MSVKVTYINHSGFMVETENSCLLFDYWMGKIPDIPSDKNLYVFASHVHRDHYSKEIFKLENAGVNVFYILSSDIRTGDRNWKRAGQVTFMDPYETKTFPGDCEVRTLKSTDEGVAFLVKVDGLAIYHAGDLHWWEWPGEPEDYNESMITNYKKELEAIRDEQIDIAFVVLDPRQEEAGCRGMDYFISRVRSRYIFPMHLWKHYELIKAYKQQKAGKLVTGEIISITEAGQSFTLLL